MSEYNVVFLKMKFGDEYRLCLKLHLSFRSSFNFEYAFS